MTFEDRGQQPLARLDIDTLKLTPLETTGTSDEADVSRDGTFLVFTKTRSLPSGGRLSTEYRGRAAPRQRR